MAIKKVAKKPSAPAKKVAVAKKKMPVVAKPVKVAKVKPIRSGNKIQTAEGWKRVMVNKLGKKRPGKSLS